MVSPPRKKRRQPTGASQTSFNDRSMVAHRALNLETRKLARQAIDAIGDMHQFLYPLKAEVDSLLVEELTDPIRFASEGRDAILLEKTLQLENARQNYMQYRQDLSNHVFWWDHQYRGMIAPGAPPGPQPEPPPS